MSESSASDQLASPLNPVSQSQLQSSVHATATTSTPSCSRTPAAATAVSTRAGSCTAVINQWKVVRNQLSASSKVTHDPQFNSSVILVEV